jgi:hypothetical protein
MKVSTMSKELKITPIFMNTETYSLTYAQVLTSITCIEKRIAFEAKTINTKK